ncbi:hypothetical protein L3Q82_003972 [Scortum barcoo]|uniref:Uncharacterized protein n=1 Tax=Scortum barcoo TaxID=214431 RepID=A0ACB8X710_9TELE|nr:hypothetical protein L3Q82_003972 [Scortum barcoo]
MAAELGSYKQAHTSSPPLTLGNSRVVEGPAPLKELGSRAQAQCCAWRVLVQGLGRRGPPPRLLPKPHCTGPSWTFLRVVSLLEGGPTSPFRAEPGRVPWAKTRPPGARLRAPTPGLAPGWGPGNANPGDCPHTVPVWVHEVLWVRKHLGELHRLVRELKFDGAPVLQRLHVEEVAVGLFGRLSCLSSTVIGRLGLHRNWSWSRSNDDDYKEGELPYWNWASGEPTKQYCGSIGSTGEWLATNCSSSFNFVCYDSNASDISQRFILGQGSMDWFSARAYCREQHTDLARVRSQLENKQLQSVAINGGVWVGLTWTSWVWSDGLEPSFMPWSELKAELDRLGDCAVLDVESDPPRMTDESCGKELPFFCYSVPLRRNTVRLRLTADDSSVDMNDPAVMETMVKLVTTSFLTFQKLLRPCIRALNVTITTTTSSRLHRLTQKGQVFQWSEDCAQAFAQLRSALTEPPVLAYPDARRSIIVDIASNVGLGAVLSQEGEQGEQVIAYFSRSLSRPERNYYVTHRELLGVILSLHHFRPVPLWAEVPPALLLTWLLNFKEPEGQLVRWLEMLQDYDFEVRHRAGCLHANTDALSR